MANDLAKKLLNMKNKIEETQTELNKTEGALEQLHKRLKSEFKVDSVEDAQELLNKKQEEIKELKQQIETSINDLESNYDWN